MMKQVQETYIFENDRYLFKLFSSHEILETKKQDKIKYKTKGEVVMEMEMELPLPSTTETIVNEMLTLTIVDLQNVKEITIQLRPQDFDGLISMLSKSVKHNIHPVY